MGPLSKNRTPIFDCAVSVLKLSPFQSTQVRLREVGTRVNKLKCYFYSVL